MKFPDPRAAGAVAFDLTDCHGMTPQHNLIPGSKNATLPNTFTTPNTLLNHSDFPSANYHLYPNVLQTHNITTPVAPSVLHRNPQNEAVLHSQPALKQENAQNSTQSERCMKLPSNFACSDEKQFSYTSDKVVTAEIMHNFLQHKTFNSVAINVPHVAQKSYGSEKRFLCPPPAIVYDLTEYGKLRTKNSTKTDSENGASSEQNSESVKLLGAVFIKQLPQNTIPVQSSNLCDSQTLKNLYVSDSDHVKDFKVQLKLVHNHTNDLGSYFSTDIKVISKPSKKKQTQKTNDLCIESGSKIALFNRLRSQNVNTRYLVADKQQMTVKASSKMWGIFYIHLVDDNETEGDEFCSLPGNITYGSHVKLVCAENGMALPRLVIRKVDKQSAFLDCVEVVSQLHKCAFSFAARFYLSLSHDQIIRSEATKTSDQYVDLLTDNAIWTIISADSNEVKFYEALGPTPFPISPSPKISDWEISRSGLATDDDDSYRLVLRGENFHHQLSIWFNAVPSKSVLVSASHIECIIPPISEFTSNNNFVDGQYLTVEIYLVRNDGVIFHTGKSFTYNPSDHCFADGVLHPLPFKQFNHDD